MCGIVGTYGLLPSNVEALVASVGHRGPDNSSHEIIGGNLFLGHTRLSVIDLSVQSNQPIWDVRKRACMVFNGEIYNYKELRADLIAKGYQFTSMGDAEVILNLFLDQGVSCFELLRGVFSFAIWSEESQSLFLVRDQFGVKPLYYCSSDSGFVFGSEMKSILETGFVEKNIDHDALFRSFVFLYSPGESTLIQGIKKLGPGTYLEVKNHKIVSSVKYWEWPAYQPDMDKSEDEFSTLIIDALKSSVDEQLVADVEVGSFLSGGLDSSLLAVLANNSCSRLKTFTIDCGGGSDGFQADLPYARRVAQDHGMDLDIVPVKSICPNDLSEMIYHLDEVQGDPAPINLGLISELAKDSNIKVLLSGAGGDDVFSGYRRHYALMQEPIWSWMPLIIRRTLKLLSGLLPKQVPLLRRVAKAFSYADKDEEYRLLSYFFWIDPEKLLGMFTDKFRESLSADPLEVIIADIRGLDEKDPLERMLYLERKYFLVDHNLNYTDKMSMKHGVEVRTPFLDVRVAELAATIPSRLKQNGRVGKFILKKAAEKFLDKSIIYRKKTGFGAPLKEWLNGDLVHMKRDLLSPENIAKRGIFKYELLREMMEDDESGKGDYSYVIFTIMCYEIWCQRFIDIIKE